MVQPTARKQAKRHKEEQQDDDADPAKRLAVYGERFMQMFDDDHDSRRAAVQPFKPAAGPSSNVIADISSDDRAMGCNDDCTGRQDQEDLGAAAGGADLVADIFDGPRKGKAERTSINGKHAVSNGKHTALGSRGAGPAGGMGGGPVATAHQQRDRREELARLKAERKRFMSPKAAVVTSDAASSHLQGEKRKKAAPRVSGADAGISREEFRDMQREVNLLGASALDKRSRKAFQAGVLAKMGAKAEARPRIPARIGLGMSRKQAQREERALQEGIASGMIQQKGLGKKKRREKAKNVDRGLNEDNGAFRPGILRVRLPPNTSSGGKGRH